MIGALNPHIVQPVLIRPTERMLAVACCGRCGCAPRSADARICTRTDCGLADRFAHERCNAA